MSVAQHFEALGEYGAMAMRVVPVQGEPEDMVGEGGLLCLRYEQMGRGALLSVFTDGQVGSVLLADDGLEIAVARQGSGARFVVRRGGVLLIDERVELPGDVPVFSGPLFRPDPASEVDSVAVADPATTLMACRSVNGEIRWFSQGEHGAGLGAWPLRGVVHGVSASSLGAASFRADHGTRLAYVAGAMAGGIASVELVTAMGKAGLLGFFGAGGLPTPAVEAALKELSAALSPGQAWGANLLNNPNEPAVEEETVDLYLRYGVRRVSASAYMDLSPAVVRYRLTGIRCDEDGRVHCPNHVFAKISRPEVAEKFMRPAPAKLLATFVSKGILTDQQAEWAKTIPVASDITAEADSGGHTDHRPALVLLPLIQTLRDRIVQEQGYLERGVALRVGLAGGLGTPAAVWAAFAMGADYVLTGSVNQACVEAGTSQMTKVMLQQAAFSDVSTGPAPDMFELGAKVQVLSRGSMYARRAQRLYDLYKRFDTIEDIPAADRTKIESQFFKRNLDDVWEGTREYWAGRDPAQVARAERDGHYKMALTFRWYLGMTSRWARMGDADRKRDFQVWCGPSMGGFNEWAAGTDLEEVNDRHVVAVADALMNGAALGGRLSMARAMGLLAAV